MAGDPGLGAVVVGGSLGGLSAGLALHGAGLDVRVHERSPGPMSTRGAGIVVQGELLDLLRRHGAPPLPATSCSVRRHFGPQGGDGQVQSAPQRFTSWEAIYRTLRAAFPAERYHMASVVEDFGTASNGGVRVHLSGGRTEYAGLLVCADGANSPSRRRLLPDVEARYAGYVAWRGVLEEAAAPSELVRFLDDAFTFSEARAGGHILAYFIPGEGADPTPGRRRLNWVWYVHTDAADLRHLLVDRDGRRHRSSLPQGLAPAATVRDLHAAATRELHPKLAELVRATPDPFLQTIVDVVVPRTVFARTCLVGDAAFVVRPHTAGAAAKAARDASLLAQAMQAAGGDLDAGLAAFEAGQLAYGRDLVRYGIALGQRLGHGR